MAYQKGINVNVQAESGQTDEETIEMYEGKIPEMTLALKGDERLNEILFEYHHQQNLIHTKQAMLDEGYSESDAIKIAQDQSDVLHRNALSNYEKLKQKRAGKK